ncbi:Crp/Fnr family transcriptional regulator [Rhizosphaericola mali]|uniref:Crp/Fnr family transcriptional regulator n=1 Tax=Rhizosphaericola mali TaxID=2545455 RepID=A0A5P2G2Z5_9BACT|nr:Crp/Fnr family transcriptional regulator [Rhizosphaericola mali]QES90194.1 Crp/Fnr family transcriptional regulator [Rhizosphaericola mali]
MEKIKKYLEEFGYSIDADWKLFQTKIVKVQFPKKHILLKKGEVEQYIHFLESGIVKYGIPMDNYDSTFNIIFENSFFSAYDSYLTRLPCLYNVVAVTDLSLWRISYDDMNLIYENTQLGDRIGRKISEALYVKKVRREISLLADSATKRYLDLFEEQPELALKIPLKDLASYIGIRPQSLSRIRKELLKSHVESFGINI